MAELIFLSQLKSQSQRVFALLQKTPFKLQKLLQEGETKELKET